MNRVCSTALLLTISVQALTKYQMLFRHLFYCKHVERQLCKLVVVVVHHVWNK